MSRRICRISDNILMSLLPTRFLHIDAPFSLNSQRIHLILPSFITSDPFRSRGSPESIGTLCAVDLAMQATSSAFTDKSSASTMDHKNQFRSLML